MAVLFQSINRMIQDKRFEGNQWYHALTIDCGGGTTDLTSGQFRIDNTRVSYVVDLETRYENGDTNFGGNNLTYRILQLLKIRIAERLGFLQEEDYSGREDMALYESLEKRYSMAEKWIPTRFKDYEERKREEYFFVKNNFYYLFALAEDVKKAFSSRAVFTSCGSPHKRERQGRRLSLTNGSCLSAGRGSSGRYQFL